MLKYFRKNEKENFNSHVQLFKDNKSQKHKSHSQLKKCEKHGLLLISVKPVCSLLKPIFLKMFWEKKYKMEQQQKKLQSWSVGTSMVFQTCCAAVICLWSLRTANKFQNIGFPWWTAGDSHNWSQAVPMPWSFPWHCPPLLPAAAHPTQQESGLASTGCCSQLKNTPLGLLCWAGSSWNEGEVSQGYFPAENNVSPGEGKRKEHQNFTILATWV